MARYDAKAATSSRHWLIDYFLTPVRALKRPLPIGDPVAVGTSTPRWAGPLADLAPWQQNPYRRQPRSLAHGSAGPPTLPATNSCYSKGHTGHAAAVGQVCERASPMALKLTTLVQRLYRHPGMLDRSSAELPYPCQRCLYKPHVVIFPRTISLNRSSHKGTSHV